MNYNWPYIRRENLDLENKVRDPYYFIKELAVWADLVKEYNQILLESNKKLKHLKGNKT